MPAALFDWDNTLHDGWTLEHWVIHLIAAGVVNRDNEPEWRALRDRYATGRIGHNRLALEANRGYAAQMAGRPAKRLHDEAAAFVHGEDRHRVFPWAAGLLRRLVLSGVRPAIITGAWRHLIDLHLEAMELDPATVEVHAFTLSVNGGRFTGRIRANPGVGAAKRRVVERLAAHHEIVLAAGDSESDLPLLRAARRQLIVGDNAATPALRAEFAGTGTWIPDPATATLAVTEAP